VGACVFLDLEGAGPNHIRLTRALKAAILDGRLRPGCRLPATRELASDMGLSRNTVLAAYEQLRAEGFVHARVGSGTYVAHVDVRSRPRRPRQSSRANSAFARRARSVFHPGIARGDPGLRYNLQVGEPLAQPQVIGAWRRELSRAAAYTSTNYPPAQGLPALRESVCDYLARRRGIQAQPEEVLIVGGTQQALSLAARVLLDPGERAVIEEPHYFGARQMLAAHGARLFPVPTDADGLDCSRLPDGHGTKLVYATPSHQFPGGSVMSLERRLALLEYASRQGCWILEDDYDSEFRYDVRPLATLRSLDEEGRVIYVGSFSKVLFPALRLGYLVLPPSLRRDFVAAKWLDDFGCSAVEQSALATFMSNGGFERHLKRSMKLLKARRAALVEGLERHASDCVDVADSRAGMHMVAWLTRHGWDNFDALMDQAREAGVGLLSIAPFYLRTPPRPGLLLGYAGLAPRDLQQATMILGRCLRATA